MNKRILASFALLFAAGMFTLSYLLIKPTFSSSGEIHTNASMPTEASSEIAPTAEPAPSPAVTTLRFSATGDNLIHNGIYKQAARRAQHEGKSGYDFSFCFDAMRKFYSDFDINWLNQETLINDELEPSTYPCFSTPGDMGRALYDLGFRVFSLSNNHSYDKGASGIAATRRFWNSMPADTITCGLYDPQNPQITIQEKDGISIAYLSYTEHTNGIPHPKNAEAQIIYTSQTDLIEQQVKQAANEADLVIVSTHWGVEGSHKVTDAQRLLAQKLANWGADVIIGTHPHVVQDAEWLTAEDGHLCFVAYSLGNFLNAQSKPDCMIGAILSFEIEKIVQPDSSSSISIKNPQLKPVINHYDAQFANIRVYPYQDYTEQLANNHGIREEFPEFGIPYIEKVLSSSIQRDFLVLD